jgi:hypothetical protein
MLKPTVGIELDVCQQGVFAQYFHDFCVLDGELSALWNRIS